MDAVPTSSLRRLLAIIWLLLCATVLAFGYARRDAYDMSVAFTWMLILLSAPAGFLAIAATKAAGVPEMIGFGNHPFFSLLPLWVAAVIAGYFQWFVVVPLITGRLTRSFRQFAQRSEQIVSAPESALEPVRPAGSVFLRLVIAFLASLALLIRAVASVLPYGGSADMFVLWLVGSLALLVWCFVPLGRRLTKPKQKPCRTRT
jgi:hypothetical protein